MQTLVINLPQETARKQHIQQILKTHESFSASFIDAVYGKDLSDKDIEHNFDIKLSYRRYGRFLNRGEIGCTLSHYKCYKELLQSDSNYALILEDDITILHELSIVNKITQYIDVKEPVILFLSGDYWYYKRKHIDKDYDLAYVYDAVGSYAYLINKSAAQLILKKNAKAACTADNWSLYRDQGVKLKAIYPYLIDANIDTFESTIEQTVFGEIRKNMPLYYQINAYWNAFVKKTLLWRGRFVSKIRL